MLQFLLNFKDFLRFLEDMTHIQIDMIEFSELLMHNIGLHVCFITARKLTIYFF